MKFIVHEDDREYEFLLTPGLYIVGRDPTCDLTLESKRVSRRHMSCTVTENEVQVRDLGSRNGVQVNGEKIKEKKLTKNAKIRVGDVTLDFKSSAANHMAPAAAGGKPEAEQREVASAQPTVEDGEETPPEGTLVRREDVDQGTDLQKQESGEQPQSLLKTKKGRLILASLAGGVVVLLLLAAVFGGGGSAGQNGRPAPEFETVFNKTLEALDKGNIKKAAHYAKQGRRIRPESKVAEELVDLVRVWENWQKNFFQNGNYRQLKDKLITLYQYYDSPRLRRFKQKYDNLIRKEIANSDKANEARRLYKEKKYEQAWEILTDIPEESAVRERDSDLYNKVRKDLRSHLEQKMQQAANRQKWTRASEAARKLRGYFDENRKQMNERLQKFSRNAQHASRIREARQEISDENYQKALTVLKQLPPGSIYAAQAKRLRQRAKARGKFKRATKLYNRGEVDAAIQLLKKLSVKGAKRMRKHVIEVAKLYKKARATQEKNEFEKARKLWEQLLGLESDPDNIFHQKAQDALRDIPKKRKELARSLVEKAKKQLGNDTYGQCRELAEQAVELDPDDTIGAQFLEALKKQGRNDYRVALNRIDDEPEEALRLLKRALEFLSTDDPYYMRARDAKAQVEQKLGKH